MARTPVANTHNGLLSADAPGTMPLRQSSRRSTSLAPSDRSGSSRITLVENDPELIAYHDAKSNDSYESTTYYAPKFSWTDHLRGLFCLSPSKKATVRQEYRRPMATVESENDEDPLTWPSPWILPVYVYANREDRGSEAVPKVGKCTIDTGNLQGNIVSREFLERVLEYPPERFRPLTKEEEKGGTGITGDLHVPDGAVYLTWYHKNSTRVFRDMRFLISPHRDCELVIGARSIHKDGILNVPCLMTGHRANDRVKLRPDHTQDQDYVTFNADKAEQRNEYEKIRNDIVARAGKEDPRKKLPGLISQLASLIVDIEFYKHASELYDVLHNREMSNQDKLVLAKPPWEKLRALESRNVINSDNPTAIAAQERLRVRLQERALADDLQIADVWQELSELHPLSAKLKRKLVENGKLSKFWADLQAGYELCAQTH